VSVSISSSSLNDIVHEWTMPIFACRVTDTSTRPIARAYATATALKPSLLCQPYRLSNRSAPLSLLSHSYQHQRILPIPGHCLIGPVELIAFAGRHEWSAYLVSSMNHILSGYCYAAVVDGDRSFQLSSVKPFDTQPVDPAGDKFTMAITYTSSNNTKRSFTVSSGGISSSRDGPSRWALSWRSSDRGDTGTSGVQSSRPSRFRRWGRSGRGSSSQSGVTPSNGLSINIDVSINAANSSVNPTSASDIGSTSRQAFGSIDGVIASCNNASAWAGASAHLTSLTASSALSQASKADPAETQDSKIQSHSHSGRSASGNLETIAEISSGDKTPKCESSLVAGCRSRL
jgi:hypothetical protein